MKDLLFGFCPRFSRSRISRQITLRDSKVLEITGYKIPASTHTLGTLFKGNRDITLSTYSVE